MTLQFWFWLFYVGGALFGLWYDYEKGQPYPYRTAGYHFLVYVLLFIIGLKLFGSPVQ